MNTPDQNPAPVNPLSGHIHETDDMTVQFASWELQDKLMRTVMAERMNALGITEDHEGDEAHDLRTVIINDPESIQRFAGALAAPGEDITEGMEHDIGRLNINLADLGLNPDQRLDLEAIDPVTKRDLMFRPGMSKAEQASAMLQKLWPVPGRLTSMARTNRIIHEFYQECQLLQTEIILNTIEEIADEDLTTLRGMLIALTVNPDINPLGFDYEYDFDSTMEPAGDEAPASPAQQERMNVIDERIRRQMERADTVGIDRVPNEEDAKRSVIYGTASYLRASAECARRMQQKLREDDREADADTRYAIQLVLFDVAAATQPAMNDLFHADPSEYESTVRRGQEAKSQIMEIYEAEFRKFNEKLPVTIMPGLTQALTDSTRKLAGQIPVDIAGITLAIINEPDLAGFGKLNPKEMNAADDYREIHPTGEVKATNTMIAYHHEGHKYVQLPHEPYVRGYPAQRAWSDAVALATLARHPNPFIEEGLQAEANEMREAADENVHDIDSERIQNIVDSCRATGMSDVAIREIVESMVMFSPELTERLVDMTDLESAKPSRCQVRKIVSACRNAGLDEHSIANMLEEIGWDNMKSAGVKRHHATRQHALNVTSAVQEAYSDQAAGVDAAEHVAETLAGWRE